MRKYLDEKDIINTIRLELQCSTEEETIWVLVEGQNDRKLYDKLIDGDHVEVREVHGGITALCTAIAVLTNETNRVIGIRDADFLRFDNKTSGLASMFMTDYHDAEVMMLMSDETFRAVVSEFLVTASDRAPALRDELLENLNFLGGVRLFNYKYNLSINFKGLSIKEILDSSGFTINREKCLRYLCDRSPDLDMKCELTIKTIDGLIQNFKKTDNCGHDFEKIFAHKVCAESNTGISDKDIGSALRLAFGRHEFQKTQLFSELRQWVHRTGYPLFSEN